MHPVQHPPPGVMSGQAGPGVSRGFKAVEDVYLSFKDVKDVIQHSSELTPVCCCWSTWFHLPPITVKEFLVENGSVGTKEGYRVKVGWVNGILKW